MEKSLAYTLLGLLAGILGGIVGIGGGIILVPALVILFGFAQHTAQGTTLAALVPPVGLLAAWVYYKNGHINLSAAWWIACGFILGGYFGAKFANSVDRVMLQRIFGTILLLIGSKMLIFAGR